MKKAYLGLGLVAALAFGASAARAVEFDRNVPADVKAQATADLNFVGQIKGSHQSPLHKVTFGQFSGPAYTKWFNDRIENFGYDPDETSGAIAYNNSMWSPKQMMVTDYFVKGDLPQAARIITLFHEARHSEEDHGYWYHVNCPSPYLDDNGKEVKSIFSGLPISGRPACDTTYLGAYGTGSLMLINIGRFCENCTEKLKQDADLYGRDNVQRLLKTSDRQTLLKDANELAP